MINAAIIGVSGFGDIHYKDLIKYYEKGILRIAGATIINQAEEREKCNVLQSIGCRIFSDSNEMLSALAGKIDLCFIPTGISLHAPMTVAALRSGANVLVEKPAAATIEEIEQMKQAEAETGKFVAVAYQHAYLPQTMLTKEIILSGRFGKLKSIKVKCLQPRDLGYYTRNNWAGKLRYNGHWVLDSPFNNAFAHHLNLVCFFAGEEIGKSAEIETVQSELYRANDIKSADTACIRVITTNGTPICYYTSHVTENPETPVAVIECETGSIIFCLDKVEVKPDNGPSEEYQFDDYYRKHMIDAVCNKAAGNDNFICSLDIAGKQTLCINGAHSSSRVNKIPDELIMNIGEGKAGRKAVKELNAIFEQAFKSGKLFSEIGVAWSSPGEVISMGGYQKFTLRE